MSRHEPASRREHRRDPMSMSNQPALQTSSGLIWIVVGGCFAIASLVPLVMLALAGGASTPIAVVAITAVLLLYAAIIVLRFAVARRPIRLWWMAACMLMMAAVALVGIWAAAIIEAS